MVQMSKTPGSMVRKLAPQRHGIATASPSNWFDLLCRRELMCNLRMRLGDERAAAHAGDDFIRIGRTRSGIRWIAAVEPWAGTRLCEEA